MSNYPAHDFIIDSFGGPDDKGILQVNAKVASDLKAEHESLLRQYQKLREAVCVLEPDTIGQVGDLYYDKFAMVAFKLDQALIDKWDVRPEGHIAERGGKPCVYRSELEANEQLGEK